jgi:hypothetical protein
MGYGCSESPSGEIRFCRDDAFASGERSLTGAWVHHRSPKKGRRRGANESAKEWHEEHWQRIHQPDWYQRRADLQSARGHRCESCGVDDVPLQLHHVTYEHLWNELDEDLMLLCDRCHESVSRKYRLPPDSGSLPGSPRLF